MTKDTLSSSTIIDYIIENNKLYRKDIKKLFNTSLNPDKITKPLIEDKLIVKKKEKNLVYFIIGEKYKNTNNKLPDVETLNKFKKTIIDENFTIVNNSMFDKEFNKKFRRRDNNKFIEFFYLFEENFNKINDYDLLIKNMPFYRTFALKNNSIYVIAYSYDNVIQDKKLVFSI